MNWESRLARAEKRGGFTHLDRALASSWTSCAVGENKGVYKGGACSCGEAECAADPIDDKLHSFGMSFGFAVTDDDVAEARANYDKIQERLARLPKKYRAPA